MTTFQIIGLIVVALLGLYVFYCIYDLGKFNKKKDRRNNHRILTMALLILAMAMGNVAWAQVTFDIQASYNSSTKITTFTITRSGNSLPAQTINFRTVNLSAYAGQHFTAVNGTYTFPEGINTKTVEVAEGTPSSTAYAYLYQQSDSRSYRFEVLDVNGFQLASCDRSMTTGVQFNNTYVNKSVTDLVYFTNNGSITSGSGNKYKDVSYSSSDWIQVTDAGYKQALHSISTLSLFNDNTDLRTILNNLSYKIYATVYFTQKEEHDGYQYIQIYTGNSYDDVDDPNGDIGTLTNSLYRACFILSKSANVMSNSHYQFFPHRYDYHNKAAETAANMTNYEFDYDDSYLYKQKFLNSTYQASTSGSLVLPANTNYIKVRFDAGGGGTDHDEWDFKNLKARLALVDATKPTLYNNSIAGITVSAGPYVKGNTFYISVPFSEIVHISSAPQSLITSWGRVYYESGDYTNVITFKGTINANAGQVLAITDIDGCLFSDLAGNFASFDNATSFDKTFTGVTCSESYTLAATNTSFSTLNGDYWVSDNNHLPQPEPIVYFYKGLMNSSNRVTLTKNTNYTFSWSNNTAAGTGTVTATGAGNYNGSASTTFPIRWGTYTVSFHENGSTAILATGSMSNQNFQYGVAQNLSANTFSREGFTFAGWNTQPDGSGTAYNDGEAVTGLNPEDGGTVDLYAQWTPIPWTGSGDNADDPYVIIYASQLDLLSDNIRNGVSTYSGKFFQLDTDIVYVKTTDWYDVTSTEHNFNTIGTSTYKFEGTFDGNGNTISGIRIYMPNDECQGLFGYVDGGTVKNVTLRDTRIIGKKNSGGIVGFAQSSTIENCLAVNVDLKITENKTQVGIILGFNPNNNTLTGNHYFTCRLTKYDGTVNTTRIGTNSEDRAGARSVHYINLDSNITASGESVAVDNVTYYASNTTITLGYTGTVNTGYDLAFTYNDGSNHAIKGLSFEMLAEDISVSATLTDVWGVTNTPAADGSQDHPYMITSTTGLDLLAKNVNGTDGYTANTFSNKYFKLDDDITYNYEGLGENESNYTAIGYDNFHYFQGKFDGDGHTISGIRINTNNQYQGLFGYVCYGEINNVILANSIITGHENVGGIAGRTFGSYENNCRVESSVTIKAAKNAADGHGGIVGWKSSGTMSGCISAATISNNGMSYCGCYGGIVGQNAGDLKDCLYTGNSVTASNDYGSIVGKHNSNYTLANNYYTSGTLGGVNGSDCNGARRARVITLDEDITLAGDQTAYNLSGLTAIGTTVLSYNNGTTTTIYSGATQDVTLSYTGLPTIGYEFTGFTATNNGTINGNTLTMPDNDVNVSKTFIDLWGVTNTPAADGSQEHPYMITSTAGLDLLAKNVNGTDHHVANGFSGMFFKLGNDITYTHTTDWNDATSTENNYTAIGRIANSSINSFLGIFNGCGHTVSGIRIYKGGSSSDDSFQGLFGFTDIGTIKNVTLSDVRITGYQIVGGIVGVSNSNSNIENCFVISGAISGTNNVGAVVGSKDNSTLSHNYYHNCIVEVGGTSYTSEIGLGAPQGDYVNEVSPVYSLTPDTGIATTTTVAVNYNNTNYYTAGTTITLSYSGEVPVGYMVTYSYNDGTSHAVTGNSFTMPAANASVSYSFTPDIATYWHADADHDGTTEGRAYIITTTTGLNLLASEVNGGNNFYNTFFKLGDDITYSHTTDWNDANSTENNFTAIGTNVNGWVKEFSGTFNGCGYTVSGIRIYKGGSTNGDGYQGLFGGTSGATIKNVTLSDACITGRQCVGGIVGYTSSTIENCHVSDNVAIHAVVDHAISHGGIVGEVNGGTVSGCTSAVTISYTSGLMWCGDYGGIAGGLFGNVQNCLVLGGTISGTSYVGAVVGIKDEGTLSHNYYHNCTVNAGGTTYTSEIGLGGPQGDYVNEVSPVFTLTLGTDISATATAAVTNNNIAYYTAGTEVTLSYSGTVPEGYMVTYIYNDGTSHPVTGDSFEMPAANVTVSASVMPNIAEYWHADADHDGTTEERAYIITTTTGLNLLASEVNNGNEFKNKFFKLGADITYTHTTEWDDATSTENNYTAIGTTVNTGGNSWSNKYFRGTFNGCGHTVSGIRIYKGGTGGDDYQGLFGETYGATIKNVTLSDARITGKADVGGIVGYSSSSTIENCHVSANVAIHAVVNYASSRGGIVGRFDDGTVSGCSSAATLTVADGLDGCNNHGGIAGFFNGNIQNCFVIGGTISGTYNVGAVVGCKYDGTLSHNYYHNCIANVGSTTYTSGIGLGYPAGDITDNDGAVPVFTLTLGTDISATATAAVTYNNIAYYTAGTEITLSYSGEVPEGYSINYSYNDGTSHPVTGNSFEMPAADVTVSAEVIPDIATWWGADADHDGTTEARAYIITTTTGLDMLAREVNNGNEFKNKFFKLGADITYAHTTDWNDATSTENNYTAIGTTVNTGGSNWSYYYFSGTFDGCGHTVSGIRIYKGGNTTGDNFQGLFGEIDAATIKNVTLSDARITGRQKIGGIVGYNYGTIENCLVIGGTVSGTSDVGAVVGFNVDGTLSHNYYHNCIVNVGSTTYTFGIGCGGPQGDITENDGAVHVYTLTLGTGIATTTTAAVNYNNTNYYTSGTEVTLSYSGTVPDGCMLVYNVNGNAINGDSFEMPAANATVSASIGIIPWGGSGSENDPWVISYRTQLDMLASRVNTGQGDEYASSGYNGKFFKLGNDIAYPYETAWDNNHLGENNYTAIGNLSGYFCGTFDGDGHTVSGIRIYKNGHSNDGDNNQGLFGIVDGGTVKNVTLSNTNIIGYRYTGGIVGYLRNGTIENCHVGDDVSIHANLRYGGGIVGHVYAGTVKNCLVTGATVYAGNFLGTIAGNKTENGTLIANYYHNSTAGIDNYTNVGCNGSDCPGARSVHALTLGNDITAQDSETVTIDNVKYYAANTEVTLSYSGTVPAGYMVTYSYNDGSSHAITGDSFTMPAANATVSASVIIWKGSGTKNDPWIINNKTQLDMLAICVNDNTASGYSSYGFSGEFFKLGDDIAYDPNVLDENGENYTAIGNYSNMFRGTFDGDNHTISGIRINKTGDDNADKCQGLFGYVYNGATIMNVILDDVRVRGRNQVGGIVGNFSSSPKIENCLVLNSQFSVKTNGASNCGAITGYSNSNLTLTNNYYYNCSVTQGTITNTTNIGAGGNNVSDLDGARGVFTLTLCDDITANATVTVSHYNTDYYTAGTEVTLSYSGTVYDNFILYYKVNFDIISGNTFIMGNGDYQVGAIVEPDAVTWWHADAGHDGTSEARAYIITSATGLNLLSKAEEVLTDYKDTYFKLGADIVYDPNALTIDNDGDNVPESNYTAIGYTRPFQGCFDGQGHTVSGIRCTDNNHTGLFGVLVNNVDSYVKNVTVADAVFNTTSTSCNSGGIVAYLVHGSVTNCHAVGVRATVNEDANISTTVFAGALFGSCVQGIISDNYYYACSATKNGSLSSSDIGAGQCVMQGPSVYGDVTSRTFNNQTCTNCAVEGYGGLYILDGGNWNVASNWVGGEIAGSGNTAYVVNDQNTIPNGCIAQADKVYVSGALAIKDGGQLITNNAVKATVEKEIVGYGDGNDQWYFIASPVTANLVSAEVDGLVTATEYDLYYLDEAATYWRNYKEHEGNLNAGFGIVHKQGYLYANKVGTTIRFEGNTQPYVNDGVSVALTKEGAGWNLVGNPFPFNAAVDKAYYTLDDNGSAVPNTTTSANVPPCTGIVVKAESANETVTFTKPTTLNSTGNHGYLDIALTQANSRSQAMLDKAMVSFDEGTQLGKFYFGTQDANIYIPQGNEELAIVYSEGQGEMPVCFKARENGEYTITVNTEDVEMAYLHLIDNITGANIDLFQTPSYTFTARNDDYASRFKLVFNIQQGGEEADDEFAFISNGDLVINGNGFVQVVDVMGHQLFCHQVNSAFRLPTSMLSAGVYVLRLVNGDVVRTQKIVIR